MIIRINNQDWNVWQPRVPDFSLYVRSPLSGSHAVHSITEPRVNLPPCLLFLPSQTTRRWHSGSRSWCPTRQPCGCDLQQDNSSESWRRTSAANSKQERVIMWGDRTASENAQKAKAVPCGGKWRYHSTHLTSGIRCRYAANIKPRPLYTRYRLDRKLTGPQSQWEHSGEEKNVCRCWDSNPDSTVVQPVA